MSGLRSLAERTRLRLKTRASKPGTWVRNPTFASSTSTFRSFFGWSNNSKKARINNCIFAQQGVLQALRPNSRDGAGIRARGAEHNRLAPARSAVVQPVSSFHRFLFRLRGPNDLLKRTPERCAIVIRPDLAGGFTNARGAIDVGQFCFFSGHLSVFQNSRAPNLLAVWGISMGCRSPNPIQFAILQISRLSAANIDLQPSALCNSRRPAVMAGLVRGHPRRSPLVGRVVENEPLPLSPPLRGERSGEGLG